MLSLQTLGGLTALGHGGESLAGAAAQRRTLALLSVLAVAGESGLSRDKLVALLWPEADPERARHSLTQAMYAARRALGADDLFVVGNDVRLNSDVMSSDVRAFEDSVGRGELERAVALYRGPFLDGFYFPGSAEFERWTTQQRARLEGRAAEALDRLAIAAESSGDTRRAVECRRRLAAMRPLDSGVAVRLMHALAAAGDRAGALQHARIHESLLRDELDLAPDPEVGALARRLRESEATLTASSPVREPAPPHGHPGVELARGEPATDALVDEAPEARDVARHAAAREPQPASGPVAVLVPRPTPASRRRALVAAAIAVIVLVGAGIAMGRWTRDAPPVVQALPIRQRVVVAPFRVSGASASLGYLRDGMVELLSTRLADDTASRSVDAGAVLGAWRVSGLSTTTDVPRDTLVRLAERLGAERVVVGSVVGTPARLILRATALAVPSGTPRGEAAVEGSADSLAVLVDRLAARLLLSQAGEDDDLATRTSESLPALRAFLAGQAALRRGALFAAMRQYELALDRDSTFALAALQLAATGDQARDIQRLRQGITRAWELRDAFAPREVALLEALAGPRWPLPSGSEELVAAWQRMVDLAPTSAEAWYALGARFFYDGHAAGLELADTLARSALERAHAFDPNHSAAARLLVELATRSPGAAVSASTRALAEVATRDTANPFAVYVRWRLAHAVRDDALLRALRDTIARSAYAPQRLVVLGAESDGVGLDDAVRLFGVLRQRDRGAERVDVALAEHAMALLRGRPGEALELTSRVSAAQPGTHAHLRLRVLDALYGEGDSLAGAASADALTALVSATRTRTVAVADTRLADVCVLAQWRLAHGDTSLVARSTAELREGSSPRRAIAVAAPPAVCATLLDASLAVTLGRRDGASRVHRLDSLALTPQVAGDAAAYAPIVVARLLERVGAQRRVLPAVRARAYLGDWPRYEGTLLLMESRAAAGVGDTTAWRAAGERVLRVREGAEAERAAQRDSVRRALAVGP